MFFVIDFVVFVCSINWVIYSPFILVDSFVDIPTNISKGLFFSELYFIKGLQRWLGLSISQVTAFLWEFGVIIIMLYLLDDSQDSQLICYLYSFYEEVCKFIYTI